MLKNAPFLIMLGVDTAENEPRKEDADDVLRIGGETGIADELEHSPSEVLLKRGLVVEPRPAAI